MPSPDTVYAACSRLPRKSRISSTMSSKRRIWHVRASWGFSHPFFIFYHSMSKAVNEVLMSKSLRLSLVFYIPGSLQSGPKVALGSPKVAPRSPTRSHPPPQAGQRMVVGSRLATPPTLPNQDLTQGLSVKHGVKLYFTTKSVSMLHASSLRDNLGNTHVRSE